MRGMNADAGFRAHHGGPDIETAGLARNPLGVGAHQRFHGFDEKFRIDRRHRHALGGTRKAAGIFFGPEQRHFAVCPAVGLHSFEDRLPVVKYDCRGMKRDVVQRFDARVLPGSVSILGNKPVGCECFAEFQLGGIEIDSGGAGVPRSDLNVQRGHSTIIIRADRDKVRRQLSLILCGSANLNA